MFVISLHTSRGVRGGISSADLPPFPSCHHGQRQWTVADLDIEVPHDQNRFVVVLLRVLRRGFEKLVHIVPVRGPVLFPAGP